MPDKTLEQKVSPLQEEKKEENKPVSLLESVLSEAVDAAKATANLSLSIAAPAAGYALTGNPGVLATSASFVAATKGKKDSKTIRNESLSGALFGTFAHYVLSPLKYLTNIGKVAYMNLFPFAANSFYMAEEHLIKNKSPKGLYAKFKETYWLNIKKTFKSVVPLNIFSALFLPQQYMVAAIAVASFLYRRFVAGGKGEEHTDKTPYLVAGSNALCKLFKNTYRTFYDTIYGIGSSLNNLYKTAPKAV